MGRASGEGLPPLALYDLRPLRRRDVGGKDQVGDDPAESAVVLPGREHGVAEMIKVRRKQGREGDGQRPLFGDALVVVQEGQVVGLVDELAVGDAGVIDVVDEGGEDEGQVRQGIVPEAVQAPPSPLLRLPLPFPLPLPKGHRRVHRHVRRRIRPTIAIALALAEHQVQQFAGAEGHVVAVLHRVVVDGAVGRADSADVVAELGQDRWGDGRLGPPPRVLFALALAFGVGFGFGGAVQLGPADRVGRQVGIVDEGSLHLLVSSRRGRRGRRSVDQRHDPHQEEGGDPIDDGGNVVRRCGFGGSPAQGQVEAEVGPRLPAERQGQGGARRPDRREGALLPPLLLLLLLLLGASAHGAT